MKIVYDCAVTKRYTDLNEEELINILKLANQMYFCKVEVCQEGHDDEYGYFRANGKYEVSLTVEYAEVDRDEIKFKAEDCILDIEEHEEYLVNQFERSKYV